MVDRQLVKDLAFGVGLYLFWVGSILLLTLCG